MALLNVRRWSNREAGHWTERLEGAREAADRYGIAELPTGRVTDGNALL